MQWPFFTHTPLDPCRHFGNAGRILGRVSILLWLQLSPTAAGACVFRHSRGETFDPTCFYIIRHSNLAAQPMIYEPHVRLERRSHTVSSTEKLQLFSKLPTCPVPFVRTKERKATDATINAKHLSTGSTAGR